MTKLLSDDRESSGHQRFVLQLHGRQTVLIAHNIDIARRVPLGMGDGVIFPVRQRPAAGMRGFHRVNMRHGVSRVRSGNRYTLGIIFHDAR